MPLFLPSPAYLPNTLNTEMVIDSRASNVVAYDYKKLQCTQSWPLSFRRESDNAGHDTVRF